MINKYVMTELDERHNDLAEQISGSMNRVAHLVPRAHEEGLDDYVIREYARIGHILARAYRRLDRLEDHL